MPQSILGKDIQKIGVIGSGQIGPDIALYFSKIFHRDNVPVVVVDVSRDALASGEKKLHRKVDKGVETGAFSPDMGSAMKSTVTFTDDPANSGPMFTPSSNESSPASTEGLPSPSNEMPLPKKTSSSTTWRAPLSTRRVG